MRMTVIYILSVLFLSSCGKNSGPTFSIDFAPDNSPVSDMTPSPDSENSPETENAIASASPNGILVFDAPIILIRGVSPQQNTSMDATPGT